MMAPTENLLLKEEGTLIEVEGSVRAPIPLDPVPTYEAGSLSSDLEINVTSTSGFFDGYNLLAVARYNRTDGSLVNQSIIIADMDGIVVAEKPNVTMVPAAEFLNTTTIIFATDASEPKASLWNFQTNVTQSLEVYGHHSFEYNPNSNTIFTYQDYNVQINGTYYKYDYIIEVDLEGNVVWWMDTRPIMPIDWACPYSDFAGSIVDLTHSNSIFYDPDSDVLYIHPRNLNTFYKINHTSSEVIWGLGEYGNFTLFDANGVEKDNLFYHAHAVEQVDDNTFILFDNDYHNQTDSNSKDSRILEITINQTTMTANESWSWTASDSYYAPYWGDADRLPNGNRLGVFGTITHPGAPGMGGRIVEVNAIGEVVWELNFPSSSEFYHGVYRAERFRYTPTIYPPTDLTAYEGEEVKTTWDVRYNFRPKWSVEGNYSIYLDSIEVENGSVFFDKLWRPAYLETNLGYLSIGTYNLTLAIYDEIGNSSVCSINVTVVPYYIDREGPLHVESGQVNHIITWFGGTSIPLECNITVNSSIVQSFSWTGSNISLDLESLATGSHLVELELFNDSILLYSDPFWTVVYPAEFPSVTPLQTSTYTVAWDKSINLSWDIHDRTPFLWELFLNSTLETSESWTSQNLQIIWPASHLNESSYNVTLVVTDGLGLKTSDQIWFFIIDPTPPIITSSPINTSVIWGEETIEFSWVLHGGTSWNIWRNGTIIESGIVTGNQIDFKLENWQEEHWRLGNYNITLQVVDEVSSIVSTFFLEIYFDIGDPYADMLLPERSSWYLFGDYAIGAPDGKYAIIYLDYGNGYIVLDMGKHEEIIDGVGDDFKIVARGGNYTISVSTTLTSAFQTIGHDIGNQSFDLSSLGVDEIRYIRIEYREGNSVELDAIVAINVNVPETDTAIPEISNIENFWIWENQTTATLTWSVFDATPWSYSILVNGSLFHQESWNGSDITYTFEPESIGHWNITLIIVDLFDNQAFDNVIIDVREIPNDTTTPTDLPTDWTPMVVVIISIGVVVCVIVAIYLARFRNLPR
jgi:hypothetical protein